MTARTKWLPPGWATRCSSSGGGQIPRSWRFEARINGDVVAKGGRMTLREATRDAKRSLREYAYERLQGFVGRTCRHAGFGGRTLCGKPVAATNAIVLSDAVRLRDVDCERCRHVLRAIDEEMEFED